MKAENAPDFAGLYTKYAPFVKHFLLAMGCPVQDAEDVTQETFVKALLCAQQYRGECSFSTWLCQIAKNTWCTQLKKQKKNLPLEENIISQKEESVFEWLDLIGRLEEPYQSVFIKKLMGGFTYAELASSYKKSESWARVTYYRARMQLQDMIREKRK